MRGVAPLWNAELHHNLRQLSNSPETEISLISPSKSSNRLALAVKAAPAHLGVIILFWWRKFSPVPNKADGFILTAELKITEVRSHPCPANLNLSRGKLEADVGTNIHCKAVYHQSF